MSVSVVVCLGLLASSPDSTAEALIRQALECEARGQDGERHRFLQLAVQAEPASSTARGLLGQVKVEDQWLNPDQAAGREQSDDQRAALLAQYEARRAAIPDTAAAHWKLALWCEQQGLKAESIAHLTQVTRLDPENRAAWQRLGCRWYHGRWMNAEQIAALGADLQSQSLADRHWLPLLARWKAWLLDPARRGEATRELSQVHDPRAVSPVVVVFDGAPRWQRWAVYVLGRIDSPQSAQALAKLAVTGQSSETREAAIHRLRSFDPRTYVGLLINWIKEPTRYEIERPAQGNAEAVVQIDDPQARIERHYRAVAVPPAGGSQPVVAMNRNPQGEGQIVRSGQVSRLLSNGHYGLFNEEVRIASTTGTAQGADRARAAVRQRLAADLKEIDQANIPIQETNIRVLHALYQLTGKALGTDQSAWTSWWTDQLGYHYSSTQASSKPLVIQEVSTPYVSPPPVIVVTQTQVSTSHHACFGAGTPVHTRSGLRAIEDLKIGDQVLTQDTTSGALGFEPIVTVFHNPPATVLRVELDSGDSIVATEIHRFWKAGTGWRMSRELKPGDRLRVLGGTVKVVAVSLEPRQLVYNLEVARQGDFFVGRRGALVHDATLVSPVDHPFDSQSSSVGVGAGFSR
ncbi:MAG TPA: polymorphic toxin-type HINT domain-containing protein [Isosphaeraceae bacterium]|nr:polymorphic toxin-type HINT domain-containing protein [Isosphaeraceae bacterium]